MSLGTRYPSRSERGRVQLQRTESLEKAEGSSGPLHASSVPLTRNMSPFGFQHPALDIEYDPSQPESSSDSPSSYIYQEFNRGYSDQQKDAIKYALDGRIHQIHHAQRKNKVIAQHKDRWPKDPPVIYQATIFNNSHDRRSERTTAIVTYQDDRPFQFATPASKMSTQEKNTQPVHLTAEDGNRGRPAARGKSLTTEWTGPIFEVNLIGKAKFCYETSVIGRTYRTDINIPESTEDLLVEKISRSSIVLRSHHLLRALEGLVGYYPSFNTRLAVLLTTANSYDQISIKGFQIDEPFAVVMHHFELIKELIEGECSGAQDKDPGDSELAEIQKSQMKHLYKFAEPLYHANVVTCKQHLSGACPRIAFDMIWYLLRPGTDVYVLSKGVTFMGVVADVTSPSQGSSITDEQRWWSIALWHLNTDGARIRRTLKSYTINAYSGLRDVTELPVIPVSIWDAKDKGERRKKILSRSRTLFKALQQGNLLGYHDGPVRGANGYYTGKVILDYQRGLAESEPTPAPFCPVLDNCDEYQAYDNIFVNNCQGAADHSPLRSFLPDVRAQDRLPPGGDAARRVSERTQSWLAAQADRAHINTFPNPSNDQIHETVQELTEHQLLLLYPDTFAYGLKLKQWMVTSVDYIKEITPSSESLSNLIIGEDELQTIRALSNRQNSRNKQWSADFIEGKGSGQIILLHGPPGVGKTYTVEAISEWLHRPLLALTVADIGTVETLVEQQLFKWFDLAEAWNAVLLVDEADIFLERRQNRDLGRNGLVSAFLRRMEYFKGLLFLTTNRVGQIDDAFISRVHVAIGYSSLNAEVRKKIWNGFFQKLARERPGKIQIAPDAKKWVLETAGDSQAQLNGRDIRNALQTAITLAEFESEEDPDYSPEMVIIVTKDHFQRVLEMSNKFHNYVTSIRREDERKRAQGRGDRNDYDGCDLPLNQLSIIRNNLSAG